MLGPSPPTWQPSCPSECRSPQVRRSLLVLIRWPLSCVSTKPPCLVRSPADCHNGLLSMSAWPTDSSGNWSASPGFSSLARACLEVPIPAPHLTLGPSHSGKIAWIQAARQCRSTGATETPCNSRQCGDLQAVVRHPTTLSTSNRGEDREAASTPPPQS